MRKVGLFGLTIIFMIVSCKKEEILPDTIAIQIERFIKETAIQRVIAAQSYSDYFNISRTKDLFDWGKNYTFQGDFIIINGVAWNLNRLLYFKAEEVGQEKILALIF